MPDISKFVIIEQDTEMNKSAYFFSNTQKAQKKAEQLIKDGVMFCVVPDVFEPGVHSFSVVHIDLILDVDTLNYIS